MSTTAEKIQDAVMIAAGIGYYAAATAYLFGKLTVSYSLNLL